MLCSNIGLATNTYQSVPYDHPSTPEGCALLLLCDSPKLPTYIPQCVNPDSSLNNSNSTLRG